MRNLTVQAIALLVWPALAADNWPDFRGPHADGTSLAQDLPVRWSETENVRWKTPIAGKGWSTPVIWGDQIWLTTATVDGTEMFAVCVDRQTGKITHNVKVFGEAKPESINEMNSYASPSPVIDQGRLYVHFGTYGTACLATDTGGILWTRRDLKLDHKEGPGSSPILVRDLLIVHCDGQDVQYIVALDKRSGKTAWKTDRSFDLSGFQPDFRKAYSTPLVIEVAGEPQLISTAAQCAFAYDPSSGRELWRLPYKGFSNVSRPVASHGLLFINTGFPKSELWAVRPGTNGQLNDDQIVWKFNRNVPNKPSVVLADGLVLMVSDSGIVTCLEAESGKEVWTHRLGGNHSASPVHAAGRVYLFDHDGKATVLEPGREYRELAVNQLDGGLMASPAISGQALFLRTKSHLYRIEKSAAAGE